MRRGRRGVPGAVAVLGLVLSLLGCSGPSAPAPPPTTEVSPEPLPAGSLSPLPPHGRPLQPVPNVRPAGFSDPPSGHGLARYENQRLTWHRCGKLSCASVLVPLDYAHPDATAITLRVARRPTPGGRASRTLLLNPGGPGGSGLAILQGFGMPGLSGIDLVSWDPRGAGASTPVRCWEAGRMETYLGLDGTPDDAAERTALIDADRWFGMSCLQASGPLLEHVSSAETVRDMDLIRSALGVSRIDYLGYSNGTLLGAGYAQLFGSHVGRMVLDGAVNVSGSVVSQPRGFERALEHMASWCAAQPCALGDTSDRVLAAVSTFWTGLDAKPLIGDGRLLTQTLAVAAVAEALYEGEAGWSSIVRALGSAIRAGDPTGLLAWADRFTSRNPDGSYDQFAYAYPASGCADSPGVGLVAATRSSQRADAQAPVFGHFDGPDWLCALWPVNPSARLPKLTAADAPPLVVIGTTGDPATPYEWAEGMARQLKSAVLVTHQGEGHTSYRARGCAERVVVPYLTDGTLPAPGTVC